VRENDSLLCAVNMRGHTEGEDYGAPSTGTMNNGLGRGQAVISRFLGRGHDLESVNQSHTFTATGGW